MADYFMGQVITGQQTPITGPGNAQLWNPWGSGKILKVTKAIVAGSIFIDPMASNYPGSLGADIRKTRVPFNNFFDDHASNKVFGGPDPVGEIRYYDGTPPNDYPLNRPIQEIWLGYRTTNSAPHFMVGQWQDRQYTFEPEITVPQGWGVAVSMTEGARAIVSWQWSEEDDPQGPIVQDPWTPAESLVTNLGNGANAFDASDATFASADNSAFYIGKTWATSRTVTNLTIKSPTGRSFAGANPARSFSYAVETFDGTNWAQVATGSFTDAAFNSQAALTVSGSWTGYGHRIRMTNTAVAGHRVATMSFT